MIDHQRCSSSEGVIYKAMLDSKTDTLELELEWNLDLQILNTCSMSGRLLLRCDICFTTVISN